MNRLMSLRFQRKGQPFLHSQRNVMPPAPTRGEFCGAVDSTHEHLPH